jgi:CRISPR/Cas system CSM-associated protein Csm3 (group 7 of RAMP superfamily)
MSIPLPFPKGVTSLLKCRWTLELRTPLVIRASTNGSIHNKKGDGESQKGRASQYDFRWEELTNAQGKKDEWSAIRDFNYEFHAVENEDSSTKDEFPFVLKARYNIPGSSIRGALRQSLIHSLIKDEEQLLFSLPKLDQVQTIDTSTRKKRMSEAKEAVENDQNYWHDILSLFGIAYDLNPGVDDSLIWSGRLDMGSVKLPEGEGKTDGFRYEASEVNACAPRNIDKHIKTRSPLDRVTMAAKSGGLHSGIEMSEGQTFTLEFRIVNPRPNDLKILKLWKRDIDAGFIRFGGLSSHGRGKVKIVSDTYSLYAACHTPLGKAIRDLGKQEIAQDLAGIWTGVDLDLNSLLGQNIMDALNVAYTPS